MVIQTEILSLPDMGKEVERMKLLLNQSKLQLPSETELPVDTNTEQNSDSERV